MSENLISDALQSEASLILVEAPAGFGKTYQAATYAASLSDGRLGKGRLLVLTHTHAACSVVAKAIRGMGVRSEIRTIDSLIVDIARPYHAALDIDSDVLLWIQQTNDGYSEIGRRVSWLLTNYPTIAFSLAQRYPIVIVDEHQDSSKEQHEILMVLHRAGCRLRIFADPMQAIYTGTRDSEAWKSRWCDLQTTASACLALDTPHRWQLVNPELGEWIKQARALLSSGSSIALTTPLPKGVRVVRATNLLSSRTHIKFSKGDRSVIDNIVDHENDVLVLTSQNMATNGLRSFFYRRLPIWEGQVRPALDRLVLACHNHNGNALEVARATVTFLQTVMTGFTNNAFATVFIREVEVSCSTNARGKTVQLQRMARPIVDSPNHLGVAFALLVLKDLLQEDEPFGREILKLDRFEEYRDAMHLSQHERIEDALLSLSARRAKLQRQPPNKAISTIHKAKGLEFRNVIIMNCDASDFPDNEAKRRLLYVALSRATHSLTLVLPRENASPLFSA